MLSPLPLRLELWRLLRQASVSCSLIHEAISQTPLKGEKQIGALTTALRQGLCTKTAMESWRTVVPSEWEYRIVRMPQIDLENEELAESAVLFLFKDVHQGGMWLGYWVAYIRLLQNLLLVIALLSQRSGFVYQSEIQSDLFNAIGCIVSSIPYMMNDVDEQGQIRTKDETRDLGPYFLLFGLHVANSIDDIPLPMRRNILDAMFRIGHVKGVRLALLSRNAWLRSNPSTCPTALDLDSIGTTTVGGST